MASSKAITTASCQAAGCVENAAARYTRVVRVSNPAGVPNTTGIPKLLRAGRKAHEPSGREGRTYQGKRYETQSGRGIRPGGTGTPLLIDHPAAPQGSRHDEERQRRDIDGDHEHHTEPSLQPGGANSGEIVEQPEGCIGCLPAESGYEGRDDERGDNGSAQQRCSPDPGPFGE